MQILSQEVLDYLNSICCPNVEPPIPPVLNGFDVTAQWSSSITTEFDFWMFITVMGAYPNTVVSNFVKNGNNITCNIDGQYELDLFNVSEVNLITNGAVKFNVISGSLTSAELDYCASVFLTANVLQTWNTSQLNPPTQPSSANQQLISDLCTSNGGSANF
jgi:hypothetical protein